MLKYYNVSIKYNYKSKIDFHDADYKDYISKSDHDAYIKTTNFFQLYTA